jgi:hypothetical protein
VQVTGGGSVANRLPMLGLVACRRRRATRHLLFDLDFEIWKRQSSFGKGSTTIAKRCSQGGYFQSHEGCWITIEIAGRTCEEGSGSDEVASALVVEGDGSLNYRLQHPPLGAAGFAPDVFEHFVGLEELAVVKQLDSFRQAFVPHNSHSGTRIIGFLGCFYGIS